MTRTRTFIARRRARDRASAVRKLDRPAPSRPPAPSTGSAGLIFFVVLLALIFGLWLWL